MNRKIPELIEAGGFKITDIDTMYVPSTPCVLASWLHLLGRSTGGLIFAWPKFAAIKRHFFHLKKK